MGRQTGDMAAKVLKGEAKASEMSCEVISAASLYINTAAADQIGLAIPEEMVSEATEKFTEITVE